MSPRPPLGTIPLVLGRYEQVGGDAADLLEHPLVVWVDVLEGLDRVDEMFNHIDAINDRGVTILIVEQNAKTALRRCDRGYVLAQGENRYADEGEALLNDPEVRKQFLGG